MVIGGLGSGWDGVRDEDLGCFGYGDYEDDSID